MKCANCGSENTVYKGQDFISANNKHKLAREHFCFDCGALFSEELGLHGVFGTESFEWLERDFKRKVKELQERCSHPIISEWIEVVGDWRSGSLGYESQRCEICRKEVDRKITDEETYYEIFPYEKPSEGS